MTEDMERTLDGLVARIAPDPGPGLTPLARDLLNAITATPTTSASATAFSPGGRRKTTARAARAGRTRLRWVVSVPVVAGIAAAALVLGWALPGVFGLGSAPASAALDIQRDGHYYVVKVKDLFADPGMYESELRSRGLRITLRLVPTSRSMTGKIVIINSADLLKQGRPAPAYGPVRTIDAPGPCHRYAGCPIGVKVPVDYKAQAEVVLGRAARPGERYKMPPGIGLPGEPLYCVDYVNKTVSEVGPMLRERGVEPEFVSYTKGVRPADSWYVHEGVMSAAGRALLVSSPTPIATPRPLDPTCPTT